MAIYLVILKFIKTYYNGKNSNFNKNVLNAIIWAFKHDQPTISETGLETLLILINVRIEFNKLEHKFGQG